MKYIPGPSLYYLHPRLIRLVEDGNKRLVIGYKIDTRIVG